jgi:hypothetical protein
MAAETLGIPGSGETWTSCQAGPCITAYGQSTTDIDISEKGVGFDEKKAVFVEWRLPKSNQCQTDEYCGSGFKAVSCPEHREKAEPIVNYCYNPLCPVCGDAWAAREAKRAAERLSAARGLYMAVGVDLGEIRHIVLSPPQGWAVELMKSKAGFEQLRREAYKVLRANGFYGGAVVFHPYRTKGGIRLGPHFHILGYGYLKKADIFHEETGWIYKNKGERESVEGTISYLLSHAGLGFYAEDQHFHSLTWFGYLSYNKLCKDVVERSEEIPVCEICGAQKHLYKYVYSEPGGSLDWSAAEDQGVYTQRHERQRYRLCWEPLHQALISEVDGG